MSKLKEGINNLKEQLIMQMKDKNEDDVNKLLDDFK